MQLDIDKKDFGILCICAIRYCHGRQSYMPSMVIDICKKVLRHLSDRDLNVMLEDCDFQKRNNLYGAPCDKEDWMRWKKYLEDERDRRRKKR